MATLSPVITSPHRSPTKVDTTPNVANIMLGNLHIKPWYPSFYPEDLIGGRRVEWLYVCQYCFKYTPEIMKYSAHCKVCAMKTEPPPGEIIYEKDDYVIHGFDGEEHKLYAQNLSLFAKLFLETKSVFFDASTFLYYVLVLKSSGGDGSGSSENPHGRVAGFFSKEKMSWDNNNLACILVFPPYQRRGLGQVLIGASYVLGRREGRFGGPEKPLSNLGRRGYVAYWCGEVARYVLASPKQKTVQVKDLSEKTWILPEDVLAALKEMEILETRKTASGSIVVNKAKVRVWAEKNRVNLDAVVDPNAFLTAGQNSEEDVESDEPHISEVEGSDEMES